MTDPAQRYATLLHRAASLWRTRLDERLRPWGMTQATWRTLWILRTEGRHLNQSELAASLGIETPTLVRILDRMEARGLVRREADGHDRRQKRVDITQAGRDLATEIEDEVHGVRAEMLADVGQDELQASIVILERIVAKAARQA